MNLSHLLWPLSFDSSGRWLRAGLAFATGLAVGLGTLAPARAAMLQQECDADELHAMSKRLRDDARCLSFFATKPARDPLGTRLDLCRDVAREEFVSRIDAARRTAEEQGIECSTNLAGLDPEEAAFQTSEALADILLDGWDLNTGDRADDRLRGRLLKQLAKLAKRQMMAESKHRLEPDNDRRQRRIARAEVRFESGAEQALDRAASKGVPFAATTAASLRSQLMGILDPLAEEMTAKADPPGRPGPIAGPVLIKLPFVPFP